MKYILKAATQDWCNATDYLNEKKVKPKPADFTISMFSAFLRIEDIFKDKDYMYVSEDRLFPWAVDLMKKNFSISVNVFAYAVRMYLCVFADGAVFLKTNSHSSPSLFF